MRTGRSAAGALHGGDRRGRARSAGLRGAAQGLREKPPAGAVDDFFSPDFPVDRALRFTPGIGVATHLGQSIVDVLQAQTQRLAGMEAKLERARRALNERMTVERAKGMLMARFNYSEEAAYKALRKTSMDQNRRLLEVAEAIVALPALMVAGNTPHQS